MPYTLIDHDLSGLEELFEAAETAPEPAPDLWAPRDVTPKALRGRGVRLERRLVGYFVNPHSPSRARAARYHWHVLVP